MPQPRNPQVKILIIEDQRQEAFQLERSLLKLGYEVVAGVATAQAALSLRAQQNIDLVLLNLDLGNEAEGIETAQQLYGSYKQALIVCSNHPQNYYWEKLQHIPLLGYIPKPIQEEELQIAIEAALHRLQMEAQMRRSEVELDKANKILELFFSQSLEGAFFMMSQQPVGWSDEPSQQALARKVLNENLRVSKVNDEILRQYKASREQLLGRNFAAFFHKNPQEGDAFLQELLTKKKIRYTHLQEQFDGSTIWVEGDYTVIYDYDLKVLGFLALQRDITSEKLTEEALMRSEANLKAIFENSVQAFTLIDVDEPLSVRAFNPKANELAQLFVNKDIELHQPVIEYLPESFHEVFLHNVERAKKGELLLYQKRFIVQGHSDIWLEVSYVPIYDKQSKQVRQICYSGLDITERKKAELKVIKSEQYYKNLIKNATDIIMVLDARGTITYTSPSASQMLGYSEAELVGKNVYSFVQEEDVAKGKEYFWGKLKEEGVLPPIEVRIKQKNGNVRFVETQATSLLHNPHVQGIIIISRDITERKEQEQSLLMMKRAVDASQNGILILNAQVPAKPIIYVNNAFCQMTGYRSEEAVGRSMELLYGGGLGDASAQAQPEEALWQKALHSEKESRFTLKQYRKNGESFFGETSLSPIFNRQGQLTHYIGIQNDVTQRIVYEELLKKIVEGISGEIGEAFFQSLVKTIALALEVDFAYVGIISPIYPDHIQMLAFCQDQALREPDNYALRDSVSEQILKKGSVSVAEKAQALFPKDQHLQNQEVESLIGVALKDSEERPIGLMVVAHRKPIKHLLNATTLLEIFAIRASTELERSSTIEALQKSQEKFRKLAVNSPDIIYLSEFLDNQTQRVIYINRNTLFGYSLAEINTSGFVNKFIHPDDLGRLEASITRLFAEGNLESDELEYRVFDKKGKQEWVYRRHTVMERSRSGKPKQLLINLTLITEKKAAEQELLKTNYELDSFVYRSSHDLRAPLRSILGLVNILHIEPDPQAQKEYLELIEKSVKKLDSFIADMTDFSRNSRLEMEAKAIDFEQLLKESIENLQYMEQAPRIRIEQDIRTEAVFCSDRKRLSILFQNLLSNAIKYHNFQQEQPFIKVSISPLADAEGVEIRFQDNGQGIQEEHLVRIFDMFYRANSEAQGSGLGLYIVAQVVERLRGRIEVASVFGQGSTFTLRLPNLAASG